MDQREEKSRLGKVLIGLTGGVAIGLSVICASFVSPALRRFCLPYIPATEQQIANVFKALQSNGASQGGRKLIDLGSGDGRIVIEAAKHKWQHSHGVELNPWLVYYSRLASIFRGTQANTSFFANDLWQFNVREYDAIIIFGVEQMMMELEGKLKSECKNNAKIVACRFPLPTLQPIITLGKGVDTVWLYNLHTKPAAIL